MFKPLAVHTVIKVYRAKKTLELDEGGELTKESVNIIAREFFKLLKARILGTRYTVQRLIYINAFRLADRVKGNMAFKLFGESLLKPPRSPKPLSPS